MSCIITTVDGDPLHKKPDGVLGADSIYSRSNFLNVLSSRRRLPVVVITSGNRTMYEQNLLVYGQS